MKKTIALFALVLCVLSGLVSGSLALYSKQIDLGTSGNKVAKNFFLTADKTNPDVYSETGKIAPSEVKSYYFTVANNDKASTPYITETDMDLSIDLSLAPINAGKGIPYVTAKLYESTDSGATYSLVSTIGLDKNGDGSVNYAKTKAFVANTAKTNYYRVDLEWVSQGTTLDSNGQSADYKYQGPDFGEKFSVKVTGTQNGTGSNIG
jgi:hypothetical protein